ncbi:MAG: 2-oxo acid dehydrogenase subunit E2, partial [Pirellulales bacterium]
EGGDVLNVLVGEGDEIDVEQGVIELETDKAVAEVPSTVQGKVTAIHVKVGESVKVGGKLITVAAAAKQGQADKKKKANKAEPKKKEKQEAKKEAKQEPPKKQPQAKPAADEAKQKKPAKSAAAPAEADRGDGDSNGQTAPAGPAVRRFARELGIDLATVQGTGPHGRITKDDVRASVRQLTKAAASQETATRPAPRDAGLSQAKPPSAAADVDKWGPVRRERLTKIRKTIAAKMVESSTTIPHLTNFDDADVTELEKIRQASKEDYAASGVKLTTMPFVIKAVASALSRHPVVNASLDLESGEVIYKDYVNIGIAVDTDRGLVVPCLRNVDQLGIPQIAHGLSRIADMARDANFAIEDLRGGTFTISNLGAIGGTYSTPIINAPEVAILLVGRSRMLPMVVDGEIEPRLVMPLSLSYDHRLVDGAAAARFLNDVKGYLQAPGRLLLAP